MESGTEADRPFREALKEIRTELKGAAGIIIVRSKGVKEASQPAADSLPALVIIDSHGNEMHRFAGSLD